MNLYSLFPPYSHRFYEKFISPFFDISLDKPYKDRTKEKLYKFYDKINDFIKKIDDVYFWISYRTFDKYHVVKTDLNPRYYDKDEIMFRACFSLLVDFVENELGKEIWFDGTELYRGFRCHFMDDFNPKAIDLYHWYKTDLKALENEYCADINKFYKKYSYDYIEGLKTEKLQKLIDIRRTLWI